MPKRRFNTKPKHQLTDWYFQNLETERRDPANDGTRRKRPFFIQPSRDAPSRVAGFAM
jgi:hypothetical protein